MSANNAPQPALYRDPLIQEAYNFYLHSLAFFPLQKIIVQWAGTTTSDRIQKILGCGNVEPWTVIDGAGNSLLHLAAASGSLECVVLLLTGNWLERKGAVPLNIDARDSMGQTALFKAAFNARTEVAAFLLDYGACELWLC